MKSCIDCRFHHTITGPDKEFMTICRKLPPRVASQPLKTPDGIQWINNMLWPIVVKEDWCGAYESDHDVGRLPNKLGVIAS
jgi:hypothetical protein